MCVSGQVRTELICLPVLKRAERLGCLQFSEIVTPSRNVPTTQPSTGTNDSSERKRGRPPSYYYTYSDCVDNTHTYKAVFLTSCFVIRLSLQLFLILYACVLTEMNGCKLSKLQVGRCNTMNHNYIPISLYYL